MLHPQNLVQNLQLEVGPATYEVEKLSSQAINMNFPCPNMTLNNLKSLSRMTYSDGVKMDGFAGKKSI